MPARVFISCGQATTEERGVASEIRQWLRSKGFDPYVAIQTQSIQDVNSAIIKELKRADYYIFVDFRREKLVLDGSEAWRGSLFTNQELAIAYILGFEKVIFFQQEGVLLEGLLKYMGSNATLFTTTDELLKSLKEAIGDKQWNDSYTRHLVAARPRWSNGLIGFGQLSGKFLYIDVENRREDLAAFDTVARLAFITTPEGTRYPSPNRSHLKTTGQPGFVQIIWPRSHGAFDVLVIDATNPCHVFLNNALDVAPLSPVITSSGLYKLEYEVLARDFPVLNFVLALNVTGNCETTEVQLIHE
jgi:hypothetical protein